LKRVNNEEENNTLMFNGGACTGEIVSRKLRVGRQRIEKVAARALTSIELFGVRDFHHATRAYGT